jgi:hypothetical protein
MRETQQHDTHYHSGALATLPRLVPVPLSSQSPPALRFFSSPIVSPHKRNNVHTSGPAAANQGARQIEAELLVPVRGTEIGLP